VPRSVEGCQESQKLRLKGSHIGSTTALGHDAVLRHLRIPDATKIRGGNSEDQPSCENLLSNHLNPGSPGKGGKAGGGEKSRSREICDELLQVATVVAAGSSDREAADSPLDRRRTPHLHRCVRVRHSISVDARHDGLNVPSSSLFVVPFDDDVEIVFTRNCRCYLPLSTGC
jgi:hypothetical protein